MKIIADVKIIIGSLFEPIVDGYRTSINKKILGEIKLPTGVKLDANMLYNNIEIEVKKGDFAVHQRIYLYSRNNHIATAKITNIIK